MTPFKGKNRMTSLYGWRTLNGVRQWHAGQDMVGDEDQNVRAIWSGTAYVSHGVNGGRGNMVTLFYSDTLKVICQHLDTIYVQNGEAVKQGQKIGLMGNTPGAPYSYGAHLHIEVQIFDGTRWNAVEPSRYTEVPNILGTQPGNDNMDDEAQNEPYKPTADTVVLEVGAMSSGDMVRFRGLAETLGIGHAEETSKFLLLGPMTKGDENTTEALAKSLQVGCRVYTGTCTLTIGAMSAGDLDSLLASCKKLSLEPDVQEAGKAGEHTVTVTVSGGDRKTLETLAYALHLPVGVDNF